MPGCGFDKPDRSGEWRKWKAYYLKKGCSEMKATELTCKKITRR